MPSPVVAPPAPAPMPAATPVSPSAYAALPFTVEMPMGFSLTAGRPGPDFQEYTIARAGQAFVRIYVGPSSQFPIYSGEVIMAGGRASVVTTDGLTRHALEHMFQRPSAPREIHVWTSSLDGADQALAERIADSVDAK
ncbi:hypothetical protein [Brevundimonas sp.]|uniref:hypothetical protein n=1 Tax=Brevundimonas sp. TaxID=1871086 RepID=UPI001A2E60DC|nr:hypothetical protein [Brevundimonas sp.]MBJ7485777.1 hypothetical protein [Brevundimonas sp.]